MSEIKETDITRYRLVSFQSTKLAARVYDIKAVTLYNNNNNRKLNFHFFRPNVPTIVDLEPQFVSRRELQKNQEAFKRLEEEFPDEAYMAEIQWKHLEVVIEECPCLEV